MKSLEKFIPLVFIAVLISCSGNKNSITDLSGQPLIPIPLEVTATNTAFFIDVNTVIAIDEGSSELMEIADYLAEHIESHSGISLSVQSGQDPVSGIQLAIADIVSDNAEAYELRITEDAVLLTANTPEGLFRGTQTILQALQPTRKLIKRWFLPTGDIIDQPQFAYRGTMLDVSRHFFDKDYIKEYITYLAYYKINYLHLHLSDDQGWRIEIKSWPKLTEIGGSTDVGGGPGGFYTQEDFKEIVEYAAAHYITIVPEIDMPGHTNAAVVSYPFLNGSGVPATLYTGKEVGFSTFDTRKDSVYDFIDDVIREIAAISPGEFFHIGGDESYVTEDDDYVYFVLRVEGIVRKYGKRMIGWEEVTNADLDSTSVAQIWRNTDKTDNAIEKNTQVIMSRADRMYLDMKYDSLTPFGYDWAGLISVEHGYNWSPESGIPTDHLLGIEAPLWSENFSTPDSLEYLAFPRLIGYAELGWSIPERRDWEDYRIRLSRQAAYLNRNSINFYRSPDINWRRK